MANFYTITFDSDDGFPEMYTKQVEYGEDVGDLGYTDENGNNFPQPEKEGYDFLGWYRKEPDESDDRLEPTTSYPLKCDSTYIAKWKPHTRDVSWNAMGGTGPYSSGLPPWNGRKYGSIFGKLPTTEWRAAGLGYGFVGWFTEKEGGEQITPISVITQSRTYYAHWVPVMYTVRIMDEDKLLETRTLQKGSQIGTLPVIERDWYETVTWVDSATNAPVTEASIVSNDTVVCTKWTPITYNITYDMGEYHGAYSPSDPALLKYTVKDFTDGVFNRTDVPPNESEFTSPGYKFVGWIPATFDSSSLGDKKFTAQWEPKTFTLSFNPNCGELVPEDANDKEVIYKTAIGDLPSAERTGYRFDDWTLTPNGSDKIYPQTIYEWPTDKTVYAKWDIIRYNITYDLNGHGRFPPNFHKEEEYDITLDQPISPQQLADDVGYTFNVWVPPKIDPGSTGDVTFTAQWKTYTYQIEYKPNSTKGISKSMEISTHEYDVPKALNKNQYEKTLYVTYIGSEDQQITDEVSFDFLGWTTEEGGNKVKYKDQEVVVNLRVQGDSYMYLYAVWSPKAAFLRTATRVGYDFDGWYTEPDNDDTTELPEEGGGGEEETPENTERGERIGGAGDVYIPEDDIVLYAHWTKKDYVVTFNTMGGSMNDASTIIVKYNETIDHLPVAVKAGYTFEGWYPQPEGGSDDEKLTLDTPITSNRTYYARWKFAIVQITYNGNGGTLY